VAPHPARVVRHMLDCRTAALGGHLYRCESCGTDVPLYNSCRDRHCPTCQSLRKAQWLEARQAEILPVPYFHVVFTLPHAINPLIRANTPLLLGEFFGVVNWVLQHFAADPQWKLRGVLGFVAVLHTWTQKMLAHYHLHGLVPGGAWDPTLGVWRSAHRDYLFGRTALSKAFQARFIRRLQALRRRGQLAYTGEAADFASAVAWNSFIHRLWKRPWIVYPKATARTAREALDYLARYIHKVAIDNRRILAIEGGAVNFSWRDRSDGNRRKTLAVAAVEFIRRFLLHILPPGFVKVRYYGWMAPHAKPTVLPAIRAALGAPAPAKPPEEETASERILRLTGVDVHRCPHCGKPALVRLGRLPPARDGPR
jgi:hypothetical protein